MQVQCNIVYIAIVTVMMPIKRVIESFTWYWANHELLVSWISWVRLRVPRFKSVSGRDGRFCNLTGDSSLLGVDFINGASPGQRCPGDVILSLDGLEWFLLRNRTVAYLFDRGALVHRSVVAEQIRNPKGDLVYGAAG